eukprot:NODE_7608_length_1564_cov_5.897008.p1 GENE.NODE_7608_length_1564_cov_5.897008~~NODE_7608_length_1564_cov_5.897008.p1  ORF type:complete len:520 (+),score=108.61 NODE_7608_length_1564_cov_5.897008:176-1561(+)
MAFSTVLQRYVLSYPERSVPLLGLVLPRNAAWLVALMCFAFGNCLYGASLQLGPFALLASVFTTMLVFNLLFAHLILGEKLTKPTIAACFLVCLGVTLSAIATPKGMKIGFTPSDAEELYSRPVGAIYISVLALGALGCVPLMCWYERRHPITHIRKASAGAQREASRLPPAAEACADAQREASRLPPAAEAPDAVLDIRGAADRDNGGPHPRDDANGQELPRAEVAPPSPTETQAQPAGPGPAPLSMPAEAPRMVPAHLDAIMGLIYPGSLGLVQGFHHLTMKLTYSLMGHCWTEGACWSAVFCLSAAALVTASVMTLLWLRVVLHRFETTKALPVQYGTVNVVSVCSGLIFFQEGQYMGAWQLALCAVSIFIIVVGIQLSRKSSLPCTLWRRTPEPVAVAAASLLDVSAAARPTPGRRAWPPACRPPPWHRMRCSTFEVWPTMTSAPPLPAKTPTGGRG